MLGLKPIKTLPIREKIAATLREAILSRKITAGEVLTLESTAQELGVSITPVREAFQILARDGLLELKQNKRKVWKKDTSASGRMEVISWQPYGLGILISRIF